MISIVIPLYNKQDYIEGTIKSIITQPIEDYEVIIVDDGSTDKSLEVVKKFESSFLRIMSKQNGGPASARNFGIQHSRGEWIMILDGDDTIEPNILQHYIRLIELYPECNFFCCNHYIEEKGERTLYSNRYKDGVIRNNFYSWCTKGLMPVAGACIIRKDLLVKYPFKEELKRYEDAESLFNIFREAKIYRSSLPSMTYNRKASSASYARKDVSEDFIGHLTPKGKSWWEQYAIYQLYIQGCELYPEDMKRLYRHKDFWTWKVRLTNRFLWVKSKIESILNRKFMRRDKSIICFLSTVLFISVALNLFFEYRTGLIRWKISTYITPPPHA